MSDELKAKLREIEIDFVMRSLGIYVKDLVPKSVTTPLVDKYIAQIDQAYREAGYATVRKDKYRDELGREYTQHTINYPDGSGEFVRVPQFEYMTGQEFYERFNNQLKTLISHGDGEIWMGWGCNEVRAAAKRAAGLTDETNA
jgi:hypothetical protein